MGHLPRERRITTRREIAWLLAGDRVRGADLDLYWRPAQGPVSRATSITPKFGHSSVERNKLRRRLSDLMKRLLLSSPAARDYLVRTRPTAYERSFEELGQALGSLAGRIPPESPA